MGLDINNFERVATDTMTCDNCVFCSPDSSFCSRPDELECFDIETMQDYIFVVAT